MDEIIRTLKFSKVPEASELDGLANRFRQLSLPGSSPECVVESLGWTLRVKPIGMPGSTVHSLLVPLLGGGFSVIVNGHYNFSSRETLWLVGHEIGHSLFYTNGFPPERVIPCTLTEEKFCDAFADALFGPFDRSFCSAI